MAIEKKLIHFKNRSKFNEKLNNNEILPYSIVFIADTHEIYTHGNFFGNVTNESEVENIIANSDTISDIVSALENNYYVKLEVDNKLSQYVTELELTGKGYATIGQVETVEKNTKDYTDEKVAALVNGAPETLNTLDELAEALKDNKDIVDVLNASIGNKQDKIEDLETIRQGAEKGATALQEEDADEKYLSISGGEITGSVDIKDSISVDGNIRASKITIHPNDGWSDGENIRPWYGYHYIKGKTDAAQTTLSGYYGLTFKTALCTFTIDTQTTNLSSTQNQVLKLYSNNVSKECSISYTNVDGKKWVAGVGCMGTGNTFGIWSLTADTNVATFHSNKRLSIGKVDASEALDVEGNGKFSGSVTATSFNGTATSAIQDGNGNVIADTYAVKDEVLGYDDVGGSVEDAVEYLTTSEQNLSDAEKERVKTNIGVNVPIIDHGTNDSTFSLTPNKYHRWGTMSSLSISLAPASDNTVVSNYGFEFTSGATPTSFSYPSDVQFIHEIKIEANKRYQGIISNGMGVLVSVNKL